jgi:glycine/D-amino acid oxidase-like deaminating enzyme
MQSFDWIVIGAGITGAALGYELTRQGLSVLLIDRHGAQESATRHSYGGIAYWAGSTDLTRQLCAESWEIYQSLSEELEAEIQLREMTLLLTVNPEDDPETIAASYQPFSQQPELLSVHAACQVEPLLNPAAIGAALRLCHAHLEPLLTIQAYQAALQRHGGHFLCDEVLSLTSAPLQVTTRTGVFSSDRIAICAGAWTRSLLRQAGIWVPQYFSIAESIETAPVDVRLRTIVMPAVIQRLRLEPAASQPELDAQWDEPDQELAPSILDAGALQFHNGHIRMGQISRAWTTLTPAIDPAQSEAQIRTQVGQILPAIAELPGTWSACAVAFSRDQLPLVGPLPGYESIWLFSGFSNPFALVPALARRLAHHTIRPFDPLPDALSPVRFWLETRR